MVEWVVLLLFPVGVMDRAGVEESTRLGGSLATIELPPVNVAKSMIGMEDEAGSASFDGVERSWFCDGARLWLWYCCSGVGVGG